MKYKTQKPGKISSPFDIHSIIGFNLKVPIMNLTIGEERPIIAYASGHILTILDCENNGTEYLMGHERELVYVGAANTCKVLATADENMVNIWERMENTNGKLTTVLVKTFNDPFISEPILSTGLSVDGEYLVVSGSKYLKLWILRNDNDKPDAVHELPENFRIGGKIVFCRSNNQSSSFVLPMETNLLFCRWNEQKAVLETHTPKPFSGVSHITDSSYCSNYCKGVSIAKRSVIVWSDTSPGKKIYRNQFKNCMEFQFEMRLGFYHLQTVSCRNGFIIISDSNGELKFYNEDMKWRFSYNLFGQIVSSISFIGQENENYEVQSEDNELSRVGHFFVSCESGRMYKCNLRTKPSLMCDSAPVFMTCFDLHPKKAFLCGGRHDGRIFMYDYTANKYDKYMSLPLELSKQLKMKQEHNESTCLKFSSCGRYIVAGTSNGFIAILHTVTFALSGKILKVAADSVGIETAIFSDNNEFIVFLDESCIVGLLHFESSWKLISKCRVHDSQIVYMAFRETADETGLVTISEDYRVADYTIRSAGRGNVDLSMNNCVKADFLSALKCCITLKRNVMSFPSISGNDEAYLTVDKNFKFQIRNMESFEVINTFAAPIVEVEPITMLCPINRNNKNFVAFSTQNIIGLQHLPIDGNPHKYLAMLGHPRKILHMKLSPCNKYLFTIGDDDSAVYVWKIKMSTVLEHYRSGGASLKPFCNLIPGGVTGELFNEMQDIFFHIQIMLQKERSIDIKQIKLSDGIPISEAVNFMRGIGYFPSETTVEHIMQEMDYYANDSSGSPMITFENLVKLFVNYRPPFGYLRTEIYQTLKYLGYSYTMQSADTEITSERLLEICTELGEYMHENDALKFLNRLDGQGETDEGSNSGKLDNIRSVYTISEVMKYILGIE